MLTMESSVFSLLLFCKLKKKHINTESHTVESRFLEPSVSRTSRYPEPNLVSLGFASLKLYNFTPDLSNLRFLETSDNSNQFWPPWDKLTLDNSNLRKFRKQLVRMQSLQLLQQQCAMTQTQQN